MLEVAVWDPVVAPVPRSYEAYQSAVTGRETRTRGILGLVFFGFLVGIPVQTVITKQCDDQVDELYDQEGESQDIVIGENCLLEGGECFSAVL